MNKYAVLAQDHWEKCAPTRYEALEDPDAYFAQLGAAVSQQIDLVAAQVAQRLSPELSAGEIDARVRDARVAAEEIALHDLVYSVEPEHDLAEDLFTLVMSFPSVGQLEDLIQQMEDNAELSAKEWAEYQASLGTPRAPGTPLEIAYSDDDAYALAKYRELIPLVSVTDDQIVAMPAAEQQDLLSALEPFWDHAAGRMKRF